MENLTKVVRTEGGRNQIYYLSSAGEETPFDLVERCGDSPEMINHLYTILERLHDLESKNTEIHKAIDSVDRQRMGIKNYTELAVINGLALGQISIITNHKVKT